MEVLRELDGPGPGRDHAVTIGTYDGVHVGHLAVIDATRRAGERLGLPTAVVTFHPHPAAILRPESAPLLLTDLEQKLDLLERAGVDTTLIIDFDDVRAQETAEEFVETVLVDWLSAKAVVVGHDFHFGKNRGGDVGLLAELGQRYGFEVEGLQLLARPDGSVESVSSTAIRRALADGDVVTASQLLGRLHEVRGHVVTGDERGRTIGFPTANVAVPRDRAVPGDGVYAGWYTRPDRTVWPAAVNIGKRPTFYQRAEHSLIEAHLVDFDGDLYDQPARVSFVAKLRDERRFDGIEALSEQLAVDVATARDLLGRTAPPDPV